MNHRNRERVPTHIFGNGRVVDSGEAFTFTGLDFTVQGMQVQMDGITPAQGMRVELEFDVTNMADAANMLSLSGEIMRVIPGEDGPTCGVKWKEGQDPKNIEALETYYMECFFNMID